MTALGTIYNGHQTRSLEELEDDYTELKSTNEKQEIRVRHHRTKAESFIVAFVLSQSLYSIAISVRSSSSSSLKSNEWLLPFATKLLFSLIFFMAFADAVVTFYWTQYELDINYMDLEFLHKKIVEAKYRSATRSTTQSHSVEISSDHHEKRRTRPDDVRLFGRKFYIFSMVIMLVAFSAIDLYSCWLLLCRDN
ncbi:hypothetical protein TorRG33x02_352740 [Trema orientale]|uniref:Transmembrane protein n=1 Tax=Trema orientale TaxID=63057 RepID=A0A2P5ADY7_TREOI|nr:hypothetical protein TorRG33x02_352740 [Trema orientale]